MIKIVGSNTRNLLFTIWILLIGFLGSCALPEHYLAPENWDHPRADYRIILSTSLPPHVGKNLFQARLTNPQGSPVTDVTVTFYLSMLHMAYHVVNGEMIQPGLYQAESDLYMGGDWDITVVIERPGFQKIQEKFVVKPGEM
jgi:hypothetical protein